MLIWVMGKPEEDGQDRGGIQGKLLQNAVCGRTPGWVREKYGSLVFDVCIYKVTKVRILMFHDIFLSEFYIKV